jgi:hypothetical protein
MNFKEQISAIKNYIRSNYKNYLPGQITEPVYTQEFLDFDKYKGDFTLFFDANRITFPVTSYTDDCEDPEQMALTIYLVFRNNTSEVLKDNLLEASWAFYKMAKDFRLETINAFTIEGIDFYDYAEGSKYLAVSEINCVINLNI